jgi:hypothetical protein
MRKVSELYGRHPGADIYIVGTGTSLRVFPLSLLENKITIGLNLAWQLLPVRYCISMVPHLNFPELLGKPRLEGPIWITKHLKYKQYATAEQLEWAEREYYFFRTEGRSSYTLLDEPSEAGRVLDWVRQPTEDYLYLWTSISQSAVNLAANMGAKNIILVGCDNAALVDNHHAHNQHTLWKGIDPAQRYMEYYEGLAEMRAVLRHRGVNLVNLNPFLKLDAPDLDFRRLCTELEKPHHIQNEDVFKPYSLRDQNVRFIRLARHALRLNLSAAKRALTRPVRLLNLSAAKDALTRPPPPSRPQG